jgi:hypothetical protein
MLIDGDKILDRIRTHELMYDCEGKGHSFMGKTLEANEAFKKSILFKELYENIETFIKEEGVKQ